MNRYFIVFLVVFVSLVNPDNLCAAVGLKPGVWRGVLHRQDGREIVFNFDSRKQDGRSVIYIVNGAERLLVDSIEQKGDSVWIVMPFFNSKFNLKLGRDGDLSGVYEKNFGTRTEFIPFSAKSGDRKRYPADKKPVANISGRWAAKFFNGKGDSTDAVGEFIQDPTGKLTGTFLVASGDYRYLEGSVSGDSIFLSAFDGGHAVLFAAKLDATGKFSGGGIYSGLMSQSGWLAHRDEKAALPDGYGHTKLKGGESRLDFRFMSTDGDTVSINDARYKNKVVIVQLLGSWCPNCMDETQFLSDYYNSRASKDVEIIGLAYERTTDYETSRRLLQPFRKRFKVSYPFLVTGVSVSDTLRTEKTLPQVDKIQAFPTSIFIDRKGVVRKIHSGYDGPATGEHFVAFKKEFVELLDSLLEES